MPDERNGQSQNRKKVAVNSTTHLGEELEGLAAAARVEELDARPGRREPRERVVVREVGVAHVLLACPNWWF